MTRPKGNCEECGRYVANAKLIMIPGCDKRLCNICRRREEKRLKKLKFRDFKPQINYSSTNVLEKHKKLIRPSKFLYNRLTRDEEVFLDRCKYKHDTFRSGKKKCDDIKNIKLQLKNTMNKKICDIKKESKKIEFNKKLNKSFIDGLK